MPGNAARAYEFDENSPPAASYEENIVIPDIAFSPSGATEAATVRNRRLNAFISPHPGSFIITGSFDILTRYAAVRSDTSDAVVENKEPFSPIPSLLRDAQREGKISDSQMNQGLKFLSFVAEALPEASPPQIDLVESGEIHFTWGTDLYRFDVEFGETVDDSFWVLRDRDTGIFEDDGPPLNENALNGKLAALISAKGHKIFIR